MDTTQSDTHRRIILAFYPDEERADGAIQLLGRNDYPLDRISVLGKRGASGDDPLGVYYPGTGERMKGWGRLGAFWGGLWGLLTGAAGMFLVPGIGTVIAAGPIVEALAGAAIGAGVGGGVMAGGAVLSQLGVGMHRMGVPEERLDSAQELLDRNHYLVLLIVATGETERWRDVLGATDPDPLWDFPYTGVRDVVAEAVAR